MKHIIYTLLLLILPFFTALGQENKVQNEKKEKLKLELRPNSREYGTVKYDNFQKRIERRKDKMAFQKRKIEFQHKKANFQKNKTQVRKAKILQRRQNMIQRRKAIRK